MNLFKNQYLLLTYFAIAFLIGLFLDQIGLKLVAISLLVATLGLISFLPNKYSIYMLLGFISFQGFLKIISNYHPAVHLGADLVVIGLFAKFIVQNALQPPSDKEKFPSISILFLIHFGWIVITVFNPLSLGLIPSIGGAKVYVSMFILFFFGYFLTTNLKDIHTYFRFFIFLAFIHTVFTIYQGLNGAESVLSLHPRYAVQLEKYRQSAFRPFGLTNLPGAPSVYLYTSLPFLVYFLYFSKSLFERMFCIFLIPAIGMSLLFCQVRSAIVKAVVSIVLFVFMFLTSHFPLSKSKRLYAFLGTASFAALVVAFFPVLMTLSEDASTDNSRAFERSLSSFDIDAMSYARRGALERFSRYATEIPFGAGFSRVGASAGAFASYNLADKRFPGGYFFGDNLFITLLIEIGFPGLLFVSSLIGVILFKGFKGWHQEKRTFLIGPQLAILSSLFAIFIGSYGAEGIIYNPESAFFWFFSGVLIKTFNPNFGQLQKDVLERNNKMAMSLNTSNP